MVNIEFILADGSSVMVYDVHPSSQDEPVIVPDGARHFCVWLGTIAVESGHGIS